MEPGEFKDLSTLHEEKQNPTNTKYVNPGQFDYLHNEIDMLLNRDPSNLVVDITKPLTKNFSFEAALLLGSSPMPSGGNSIGRFVLNSVKKFDKDTQLTLTSILDTSYSIMFNADLSFLKNWNVKCETQLKPDQHAASIESNYKGPWYTLTASLNSNYITGRALAQCTEKLICGYGLNYLFEQNTFFNEITAKYTNDHKESFGFAYSILQGLNFHYLNHLSENCAIGTSYTFIPMQQMSVFSLAYQYMFGPKDVFKVVYNNQNVLYSSISRTITPTSLLTLSMSANLSTFSCTAGINARFIFNDVSIM